MEEKGYRGLEVWHKAMEVAKDVYSLVKKLPKEETYALSDQMRRSAVSIPSNIAEGKGRRTAREYAYFLSIAKGSQSELETQFQLCVDIGYLTSTDVSSSMDKLSEIGAMLYTIILNQQDK